MHGWMTAVNFSSVRYRVQSWTERKAHAVVRLVGQNLVRIDARQLDRLLKKLIGAGRRYLMMHSSLAACGHIRGGEKTLVDCVHHFCDTLCLPTHSYCYPAHVSEPGPVFDPRVTESQVGRVTNWFRRRPGVVRSIHPTHSLAAHGAGAEELCANHEACSAPCGAGTPYDTLVKRDAGVLMFGASMDTYTLFHTAEDAAQCPYLYEDQPYRLQALDYDGRLHQLLMWRQNMRVPRRFAEIGPVLEKEGLLLRARLGVGHVLYIPSARAVHAFVLEALASDPLYVVHEYYRKGRT